MPRIITPSLLALAACLSLCVATTRAEEDLAVALASHEGLAYCGEGCCDNVGCGDGCCDDSCYDDGCCGDDCCARYGCVCSVEKKKVEKHCWKVEHKQICVPKVVAPWAEGGSGLTCFNWLKKRCNKGCGDTCCTDACCDVACGDDCCGDGSCGGCCQPRCGEVKCVRVLKKEKYEREECGYKWEIRRLPPCCDAGYPCCDAGGACCEAICD